MTLISLVVGIYDYTVAVADQSWDRTLDNRFSTLFTSLGILNFILSMTIILATSLRDEFAEALWQKTAGTMLRAMAILPPFAMIVMMILWPLAPELPSPFDSYLAEDALAEEGLKLEDVTRFLGTIETVGKYWSLTMSVFVFVFQWHRWRARS
ncbi:MAG: hypothetical protein EDM03_00440 [Porphyrobacter sp. IPPAS B-1204]|nr:MAG: hypothetical protein EDM03_00440 [Porphyrobacter sp. IPPAS B-1204]